MEPQEDNLRAADRGPDNKPPMKSQSYRRQSAPSLVIPKALSRSKTLSRESFSVCVSPESSSLVTSYLSSSERSFLLYGHAQLKTGMQTQDRHLFLFSDVLVVAKAKSAKHMKQKVQASVCELWTAGCVDEVCEGSVLHDRSFVLGWPTCNMVATFSSTEQKERWLSLLKSRIREQKDREEPKTIPLRVYGKGINSFVATKTLAVSNSDSTNEVIRLALQQFGIIGLVKDFQLWVTSRRDNTPYPLIGHEFPFSIHMSHVRHSGTRDADHAPKQCQFILRPRAAAPPQQQIPADLSQKSLKRRRSLISWAFWRGSAPLTTDMSLCARGALFGRPLQSVCVEGSLPKPVEDMLAFLYHEGLWTRGIFRRPAGARAVRDLRESLDAGDTRLPVSRDQVFIMAGVFKDFLRSIPGSLLCCELHQEWMDVLDEEEEEEEQVEDLQRMMLRLPKENALLLRHLLAVLHTIQSNAQENQMTSFNLSVCIAPSMLWPPGAPCSPEAEGEGARKVCELVKFMIEHCEQILGEEPASLFGGAPTRLVESWSYPLTDSSYDSLENELDTSSGGSPSFCSRRSALRGSLDSILTLSDCDHSEAPQRPDSDPLLPGRDAVMDEASSALQSMSTGGRCSQQRRRSEPAINYVVRLGAHGPPSSELTCEDELRILTHTLSTERRSSSYSPTLASPDSLDPPWEKRETRIPTKSVPSSHTTTLKESRGLHPNSWLRGDRRLSLTQQDNPEKEGESMRSSTLSCMKPKPASKPKARPPDAKEPDPQHRRRPRKDPHERSGSAVPHRSPGAPHFSRPTCLKVLKATESSSGPAESRSPSGLVSHKQSGAAFSLFRRHRPQSGREEESSTQPQHRRGSEPGGRVVLHSFARARLPSDPGLKVSRVGLEEEQGVPSEACLLLSPHSTTPRRPPPSSQPRSQQVALSVVETHAEWLRSCSSPGAEPDFDQLLFAEESYV